MNLLALDTSTERLCLALWADGQWQLHEEAGGAQASMRLLPAAQALLAQQGVKWADLHGLAYTQGPGAFTGLRGACSAVQGLALGLGIAAVAVPSLQVVAEDARRQAVERGALPATDPCTVHVVVDARMGQVYAEALAWDGHRWSSLLGPAVRTPEELVAAWADTLGRDAVPARPDTPAVSGPRLMAGSGLHLLPLEVAQHWRMGALAWVEHEARRPAALGSCAWAAWAHGPRLDAAQVMPLYVRDRVAQTTAEREAQRQVAAPGAAA